MPGMTVTPDAPTSCEIRDWIVFGPGYHKGELYTPERVRRMAENFLRLKGYLTPVARLGHDAEQELAARLARSLGFLNIGQVADAGLTGDGQLIIRRLVGVPVEVGAQVNAGRLNSGSVELLPRVPDPSDPAREIEGPVLSGVALLGEEQPAVKGFPPPKAVFPDGTPVPPAPTAAAWLSAMAEVAKTFSARSRLGRRNGFVRLLGRDLPATTICFSEMSPMPTRNELDAQLQAAGLDPARYASLSDEDLAALCDKLAPHEADSAEANPPPPPPASPQEPDTPPAYFTAFTNEVKKCMADLTSRLGAVEKYAEDSQKEKATAQTAAFSERAAAVVDQAIKEMRVYPRDRERFVREGTEVLVTRTFADQAGDAAFAAWKSDVLSRPVSTFGQDTVRDSGPAAGLDVTPEARAVLKHLRVTNPRVVERLTAPAAN